MLKVEEFLQEWSEFEAIVFVELHDALLDLTAGFLIPVKQFN